MAYVIAIVAAYLIGSIPFGFLVGKMRGVDVRTVGSKNIGATNVFRTVGRKWGLLAFALDFLKGFIPTFLALRYARASGDAFLACLPLATGVACVAGHMFTCFMKFKGGKGFMAGFATIWFVDWRMTLAAMGVFFVVLFVSRYMSVASCSAALFCPIMLAFLNPESIWVELLAIAAAALVIIRHHENFAKLMKGTESKFSLSSKKS